MTEEYEYEAEMEEAYAADLLKVFRRTVAERKFALVIVDAPNLKAAALAGFWEAGQKAGYDIFVAQVTAAIRGTAFTPSQEEEGKGVGGGQRGREGHWMIAGAVR